MSKKNLRMPIGLAVIALILLVSLFVLRGTMTHQTHIVLPDEAGQTENAGEQDAEKESALPRIEVTPVTVQSAIATLARPEQYSFRFTIERFCDGGSSVEEGTLYVSGLWSRIDRSKNSEVRHVLTDGKTVYIWYGSSKKVYSSSASLSADEEQGIPTYESVLALDKSQIAYADYRMLDTDDCIYVETAPDSAQYVERYWVSVSTGLLVSAEKLSGATLIYRYSGSNLNAAEVTQQQFTLPDGTVLREIA